MGNDFEFEQVVVSPQPPYDPPPLAPEWVDQAWSMFRASTQGNWSAIGPCIVGVVTIRPGTTEEGYDVFPCVNEGNGEVDFDEANCPQLDKNYTWAAEAHNIFPRLIGVVEAAYEWRRANRALAAFTGSATGPLQNRLSQATNALIAALGPEAADDRHC